MDIISIIITLIILIFSVVLHELAHGVAADKLGDHTARYMGRLTLNPIPHLDLFGSILLPVIMWFATNGAFVFGAAKPVPVNFLNLRNPKRDMALVSLAGPGTNFIIAIAFAVPIRLGLIGQTGGLGFDILFQVVLINLLLGVFNLIPIPPLDGSKILASFLSDELMNKMLAFERYGFLLIILFLFTGLFGAIIVPIISVLFRILIGFSIF